MRLSAPFRLEGEHIGFDLPGARGLFTTRRGGVSEGSYASLNLGLTTGSAGGAPDDDPEGVSANRDRLAGFVGLPRARFAQGRQVHETTVQRWSSAGPDPPSEPAPADGQATDRSDLAAVVLVADCLPVALVAPGAVAMVHAGWRGLAGGVLEEGVAALHELGAPGPVAAAIGPGAGACCYEVGDEVRDAFGHAATSNGHLDLKAVAWARLRAAGVETVHDAGLCTICSDPTLFFSHRRDGGVTGRQAGVVWRHG